MLISVVIGLYLSIIILLNMPYVQGKITAAVTRELRSKLHTELSIGKIDIGLFNRIIIEQVRINDRQNKTLVQIARLSAKFDVLPLFEGKIRINSVQLFGFTANLSRPSYEEQTNFQFIVDALASTDTVSKPFNIDLRINSVLVRRGQINYDVFSEPPTPGKFNIHHIGIDNLTATVSLKVLRKDTLHATISRISFDEQSGFALKKFASKVVANRREFIVSNVHVGLANSTVKVDSFVCAYSNGEKSIRRHDTVGYNGKLVASISPQDIAPFLPALSSLETSFNVNLEFAGKGYDLASPVLKITNSNGIVIEGEANIHGWNAKKDMRIHSKLLRGEMDKNGIDFIAKAFLGNTPPFIQNIDFLQLKGEASGRLNKLNFVGTMRSGIGELKGEMRMDIDEENNRSYTGTMTSTDLNVGKLIDNHRFGRADLNIDFNGFNYRNNYPETSIKGVIASLEYGRYDYKNILMDGKFKDGGFNGRLTLNDINGTIELQGMFNRAQAMPVYNIRTTVSKLRPNELHLTKNYEKKEISFNLTADFTGHSIDDLIGTISIDSLLLANPDSAEYFLDNLTIAATKLSGREKELYISSSFLHANVKGDYSYKTLPASILQTVRRYIPSLLTPEQNQAATHNHFHFSFRIDDATFFEKIFLIPIQLHYPATLTGSINDYEEKVHIEGHFPEFRYRNTWYDSGSLLCENTSDQFLCRIRTGMLLNSGSMLNLSADVKAKNNKLETIINWGNNTNETYVGKLASNTYFRKHEGKHPFLQARIDIEPTRVVMNDTVWNVHESRIEIDSGFVSVNNFLFEHGNQYIRVNGRLTKHPKDSCLIDLKNIDLSYLLSMVRFDAVEFGGQITGKIDLKGVLGEMTMNTDLNVHHFLLNKSPLGEAKIRGQWDKALEGVRLWADMEERGISKTNVTGFVSPKKEGLDLRIRADSTDIGFLYPFVKGIFSQFNGRANGYVRLFGPLSALDLEGDVRATANGFVTILNTGFTIPNDSVHLRPGLIDFRQVRITDMENHRGSVNGYVHHRKLTNLTYHFDINGTNLLMYNTQNTGDVPFYGKIYGTGNVILDGGNNTLTVHANVASGNNTEFTYVTGITTEAADNQFITFVDKTPRRMQDGIQTHFYHPSDVKKEEEEEGPPMDVRMDMLIDATENATMRIIMNPVAGDFISANGTGNLHVNYYNKGEFKMFGTYTINRGIYKLSMQEIIRKDFALNQGGTVSFSGDPYHANVNVQAVYTVPSVSLSDLGLGDISQTQSTVRVNCLMNLSGNLSDPEIHFDLELPTVNEEDRELVRNITATEEQMNTQIIYLLGIGKFYTYDYAVNSTQSNATSSLAFTTLSSQLNKMLSQWMTNKNWNIGANLSTGQEGWSDVEAEAILSGRLLNNRLLINGNFGYRDNALANTNFVGDFEARWLLTKNGEWQLKGYNQTNDRYFVKSTLTTQGIGLIYKRDFNHWGEMFKRFLRKKKRQEASTTIYLKER